MTHHSREGQDRKAEQRKMVEWLALGWEHRPDLSLALYMTTIIKTAAHTSGADFDSVTDETLLQALKDAAG